MSSALRSLIKVRPPGGTHQNIFFSIADDESNEFQVAACDDSEAGQLPSSQQLFTGDVIEVSNLQDSSEAVLVKEVYLLANTGRCFTFWRCKLPSIRRLRRFNQSLIF